MEILTKDNLSPAVGNLRGSGTGLTRGVTIAEPAGRVSDGAEVIWTPRQQAVSAYRRQPLFGAP